MKTKQTLLTGLALLALPAAMHAQLHIQGGSFHIASGAVVAVRGDVTSNSVNITGDGILLMNGTTAQNLGMNGGSIPVLQVNNSNDVTLTSPARIEDGMTLTAGDVLLGTHNLTFASTSASPTGGAANSAIVTNDIGLVKKEGLANGSPFTFPVAAAAGEISQAVVTNNAATRDINVQVKTYAQSGATEGNANNGVGRTWQIYSNVAGAALVALQHEVGTEGTSFNRNDAFVTRQTAAGVWTLGAGENAKLPTYTHDSVLNVGAAADATSYFSKSDDELNSLNPTSFLAVRAYLQGPTPASGPALMTNYTQTADPNNSGYTVSRLPMTDPYGLGTTYAQINNPAGPAGEIVDWVRLELRQTTYPYTLIQSKAGLLQRDGDIVSPTGETIGFVPVATASRIAIEHRNHLSVVSSQTFASASDNASTSYDFTTAESQAVNAGVSPMKQVNTKWTLWAGDVNMDQYIDNTDLNTTRAQFNSGVFDAYNVGDLNMDGFTDNTDLFLQRTNFNLGLFSPLAQ